MEEKKGNGIMIYDVAETAGKGIEPKRGGSLSEYPQSQRQVLGGQFELSAVIETTDDGKRTIAGYYVYDKWLRGDLEGRLEKDEYSEPTLVISNQATDLREFRANYKTYGHAARSFYNFGKPPESLIKKLAGLETGNTKLIGEGIKQENKEAWTNPVFLMGVATSITLGLTNRGVISGDAPIRGTAGFRYMTEGELRAIKYGEGAGFLRGGRPGETFFTKDIYKSATKASQRLGLESTPTLRVEFEILNNPTLLRKGTKVESLKNLPGKGAEFMTSDPVKVRLINWQPLR